ncbi:MAG: AlbA family DNA-binding domain-containing protein, partial [Candidatus Binatia bacterium]
MAFSKEGATPSNNASEGSISRSHMLDAPEELLRRICLGEDTAIELKTVAFQRARIREPSHDDLADEIAAMANTATGIIVFGVDDRTRQIVGVPLERLDALERLIFEICSDSIRPPVRYKSFRMELPDESGTARPVLKLEVPRSLFV